ncbi:molybdenum cofactor guanylyltransferase [Sideroxydans lithotrophicus]|uniref:Molybdenum cofactor guanylyltransferase n=1 Tax=Sideroxydans lithotrophicus (strain ES-1) TaxID=580332 RepID=D5CNW8_SIDLE|nr:molybdenum cofactor guanylyltransferase [Sideroxydans lithotrophicus]ADE12889.1 formate dehydrogenase family accessory protein FdhD [Sideroxydans lithotrophicus ES-1]
MIEDCTALILAGGDSRRMGQDKAALQLDGKTLLDRVTATMQQVFPKVILSVRQPRTGVAVQQVCDEQEAGGPLAGLIAGLAQAQTQWIFAVACDMPFVTPAVVLQLAGHRAGHQAVVPMVAGHPQPLAAFYATNTLQTMRANLAAGDRSLRGSLEKLDVRYVSEAELRGADPQLRSFFDLDTPEDFQAAQK